MKFTTCQITEPGRKPQGPRVENRDRILRREIPIGDSPGLLLVISDGTTRSPNGGSVANWLVSKHLTEDPIEIPLGQEPVLALRAYLERLYVQFKAEFAAPEYEGMLNSAATLSVVLLHGQVADCLWAGDSPIYHSRKARKGYDTQLLTRPDHDRFGHLNNCFGSDAPFSLHHCNVPLAADDIVTLTSDGILVDDYTLGRIYHSHAFGTPAIQEMLRISRRPPFWDDLSIVAGKVQT
jgi:serine/threonine protein phosphatase PrpC